MRRTRRRKSQKIDFQEFWDSCAQNKTSKVSKTALSGSLDRYRCSCTAAQASGDQCSADDGVLRARQLLAGIKGPGDAEMADRGSDRLMKQFPP